MSLQFILIIMHSFFLQVEHHEPEPETMRGEIVGTGTGNAFEFQLDGEEEEKTLQVDPTARISPPLLASSDHSNNIVTNINIIQAQPNQDPEDMLAEAALLQ